MAPAIQADPVRSGDRAGPAGRHVRPVL